MPVHEPSGPLLVLERREIMRVTGIWAVWVAATLLFAAVSGLLPGGNPSPWDPQMTRSAPSLARFDAAWYQSVAHDGYKFDPAQSSNNVRFYPLYPMAMRLLTAATGLSLFSSGTVISIASLLLALLILADLVARQSGAEQIPMSLMSMLFFPTAFYFAAVYSESLFLLTTIAAIWAARQSRWGLAGIAGAAAGLTRLNGVLIVIPIAYLVWLQLRRRETRALGPIAAIAVTLAGAAAYPMFLWKRFGTPLVYFRIDPGSGWTHKPTPPWRLARLVGSELLHRIHDFDEKGLTFFLCFFSVLLFGALTFVLFFRGPLDTALYCAATMLVLADSGSIDAVPRYVLPLFPFFVLIGARLKRSPILFFAYTFIGLGLFGILVNRFVHFVWVA